MKRSLSVVICALNEENNIGYLLQDILDQSYSKGFVDNFSLNTIVVISDGSTDRTVDIVNEFHRKNPVIELIINEKRLGKIFSLGKAFDLIESDYIILFDADIRLQRNTIDSLVSPLLLNDYDLVGGNPIPSLASSRMSIAERASFFSYKLLQSIKSSNPNTIYSAHGRILLVSKYLYKNVNINELSTPGDDQYLFLNSNKFIYVKESKVFYHMPRKINDYIKQNVRFRLGKLTRSKSSFDQGRIRQEFHITNKINIYLMTFFKFPANGIIWFFLYFYGYIKFTFIIFNKSDINKYWSEVKSTKQ